MAIGEIIHLWPPAGPICGPTVPKVKLELEALK